MKIKLLSAGRVLNVRVTRPGSALEGTELRGRTVKARVLSRGPQGGGQGSEGGAGGNVWRQQSDLTFLPTSGVSGACFSFKEKKKLVRKCS